MKYISEKIIPPNDYAHREGFTNTQILDGLTEQEKLELEELLIAKLNNQQNGNVDTLIIKTLGYLKSRKALPILLHLLEMDINNMDKLIIASCIFEINQDINMVDIAISSFLKLDDEKNDSYYIYKLIPAFSFLAKFKNNKADKLIERYITHNEFLVANSAKRALGLDQ